MTTRAETINSLVLSILVTVSFLLGLGILSPCVAPAATYYVATGGNDRNPGTAAAPFQTIQKAADSVNPGDMVVVDDGVYTDTDGNAVVVYVRRGGTPGAWITFKSKNKWGARVDGQNNAEHGWYIAAGYIIVQDFEVTGKGLPVRGMSGLTSVSGNSNIKIIGNHIHDIGRICTDLAGGITGIYGILYAVTIERNVIHDIGRLSPGENGCTPSTPYYQNQDHGIYVGGGTDVSIKNNIFYNNTHGWSVHIYPQAVSQVRILNNTFAFPNTYRVGHIILAAPTYDSVIADNIFYRPYLAAIDLSSAKPMSNVQVGNNLVYNGGIINGQAPSGMSLSGNFNNTDPRLVNPAALDFHLQSPSPAIDAGAAFTEVTLDFDGVPRPQGAAYDIGAYELIQQNPSAQSVPSAPNNLQANFQ